MATAAVHINRAGGGNATVVGDPNKVGYSIVLGAKRAGAKGAQAVKNFLAGLGENFASAARALRLNGLLAMVRNGWSYVTSKLSAFTGKVGKGFYVDAAVLAATTENGRAALSKLGNAATWTADKAFTVVGRWPARAFLKTLTWFGAPGKRAAGKVESWYRQQLLNVGAWYAKNVDKHVRDAQRFFRLEGPACKFLREVALYRMARTLVRLAPVPPWAKTAASWALTLLFVFGRDGLVDTAATVTGTAKAKQDVVEDAVDKADAKAQSMKQAKSTGQVPGRVEIDVDGTTTTPDASGIAGNRAERRAAARNNRK